MTLTHSRTVLILTFLLGFSSLLQAQDVYVKDTLRVGVRAEPGNHLAPFSVVTTGMQLTVLERQGDYLKIQTEKNVVGWVKASYVDAEIPAAIKLSELEKKFALVKSELAKQTAAVSSISKESVELSNQLASLKEVNAQLKEQLNVNDEQVMQSAFGYVWKALLVLIICVVGFSIGVSWHRNQAMKRLGGLRV